MISALKPWTPKIESVYHKDRGMWVDAPDYWSRPYPVTPAMQAAVREGLARAMPRERDTK